jgi:hypothetical protein
MWGRIYPHSLPESLSAEENGSVLDLRFPRRRLWYGTTLPGPGIQLSDLRGNQILEASIMNSKFRLSQFIFFFFLVKVK